MSEQASSDQVVDLVEYLRQTIAEMDAAVAGWQAKRTRVAVRLAALEASNDPTVQAVAEDYERRVLQGRPYEAAEEGEALLGEAYRRYAP